MNLARLFKRQSQPHDPYQRMALIMLESAVRDSAQAIVFGVPRGLTWDVDQAKRDDDEALIRGSEELVRSGQVPFLTPLTADQLAFVSHVSMLRYRNGYSKIPVWFQIGTTYCAMLPIHGSAYGHLMVKFQELLTWLPTTATERQPARYIELTPDPQTARRRFVEIELIMADDNTVRVEIVGVHIPDLR